MTPIHPNGAPAAKPGADCVRPSQALRALRHARGLNRAQMAAQLGITTKQLEQMEFGNQRVPTAIRQCVHREHGLTLPPEVKRPCFNPCRLREGLTVYTAMAFGMSYQDARDYAGRDLDGTGRRLAAALRMMRGRAA